MALPHSVRALVCSVAVCLSSQAPAQTQTPFKSPLEGTWDIVTVIEDGTMLTDQFVRETLIKDARLTFQGQAVSFIKPSGEAKVLLFTINTNATPWAFDLGGQPAMGSQGICQLNGDTLFLCMDSASHRGRPKAFVSLAGQGTVLMSLRRVKETPAAAQAAAAKSLAKPAAPAAAQPLPDMKVRSMLFGTWGHQDSERITYITLNPDGSFSSQITWKKGLKKLFDHEERSSGTWTFEDSVLSLRVQASTESERRGQVYSYRVTSITPTEVVYIDNQTFQRRVEWKVR